MNSNRVPVISIVGWSGTGKTTFLEKLVAAMKEKGFRVGIIKHHHGPLELDIPGKDTWRLARAGAACTAIAGPGKAGLVLHVEGEISPATLAAMMPGVDLVFTEGYKQGPFPQIEVRRAGCGAPKPASRPGRLVAVVGERDLCPENVPCFDPGDAAGVAGFIIETFLRNYHDLTVKTP